MDLVGLVIAHRGMFCNEEIPENSLMAFRRAMDYNRPIELDVQLTKDNTLVVFHDISLKRMCGVDKYVEDLTYQELMKYPLFSTKEKIPTFREVLELVNGKVLLDIEIKKTSQVEKICNQVMTELKDYSGDVLLKSFQPDIVLYLKRNSSYPIGLLVTEYPPSRLYSYFLSSYFLIRYCHPDFLAVNKTIIKKKRIQRYRKKMHVFVWTITNKSELEEYKTYADSYLCNGLPYPRD